MGHHPYVFPALLKTVKRYVELADDFTTAEQRLMHQFLNQLFLGEVKVPDDWPEVYKTSAGISRMRSYRTKSRRAAEGGGND